jgi:hypothetical protein
MLVGDGSHSTDQPSGKAQGQGRGRVGSSKTLPEKHVTSKTEYTNTQQGLPVHGIHSHVTRLMKAYDSSGFSFSLKATKSRSLFSTFSFQVLCDYPF